MSGDPFMAFVAFQREAITFQQRQLDLVKTALASGQDVAAFQQAAADAAEAGVKTWQSWIAVWTPRR